MSATASAENQPYQLFKRAGSNKWCVRFSIKGEGQIRLSLGTHDEHEARLIAHERWVEAKYRAKMGITAIGKTFTQVAEEFIEQVERESERGERSTDQKQRFPALIRRYFIPYFGNRPIDAITDKDIHRYLEWRKTYCHIPLDARRI